MRSFVHMREIVKISPRFPAVSLSNSQVRQAASDDGCVVHPSWATFAMAMSVSLVLANSFGGRLVKFRTDVAEFAGTKQTPPKAQEGSLWTGKLVLEVPAMHCGGCLETIKRDLTDEAGIKRAEGGAQNKQVCVTYRP
jgi:hypothetical protein